MPRVFRFIVLVWTLAIFSPRALHAIERPRRLLVIAPEAWHPALANFATYKSRQLPVELRSLESILANSPGVDDPEKLKRFFYDEWHHHHLGYALLVGDVDVMPVRFMVLDRITPQAFNYAFYPTDLYYGDLAKPNGDFDDWNANKESFHARYFGEVRGEMNKDDAINFDKVDYLPEIAVGRWPVSTPEEARLLAAKTESYERAVLADDPNVRRAAFAAVGGWVDSRGLMDRLAAKLVSPWQIEKRYFSDKRRESGTPPPDRKHLLALLNDGLGLAVHAGHGQTDAWERCLSTRDLDGLKNATALPVIISAGCSTAYFTTLPPYEPYVDVDGVKHLGSDRKEVFLEPPPPPAPYQRGQFYPTGFGKPILEFNPTGLGEQLLKRSANGAVAYIGCNTGSQPSGLSLVEGFVSSIASRREPRLGDCWMDAIRFYFEKENLATLKPNAAWYPPSVFFQGMKFMVFGDPSLRLPEKRM